MTTADRPEVEPDGQAVRFVDGLATSTYLAIRGKEECYRSQRYGRPLSLIVVRLAQPDPASERTLQQWLRSQVRASDVVAYLGASTYALLLPESDERAAASVTARLETAVSKLKISHARYPADGTSWERFLEIASGTAGVSRNGQHQARAS